MDVGQQLLGEIVPEHQQSDLDAAEQPKVRDPAAGRFPEREVWISSHRSRIWSRSRHVVVFMVAACLSSESVCGSTL